MARTVYLDNNVDLVVGYGVDTTVLSAGHIDGGTYYDSEVPPVLQHYPPIGVWVIPASMVGIAFGAILDVAGIGRITVTGLGPGGGGIPAGSFTYGSDSEPLPGAGASARTPWIASGPLLYTKADNSVTLSYYSPVTHDLYYRTQKTVDSGAISGTLDGTPFGPFSLYNATTILTDVLLAANVPSGNHTVTITADVAGATFVYFNGFAILEHDPETGGEYLYTGPTGTLDDSSNNFAGDWSTVAGFAFTPTMDSSVFFYPQLDTGGKVAIRVQKTPDSCIIGVGVNGTYPVRYVDLYADPGVALIEITLLDTATGDTPGEYAIELRNTGTKNSSSSDIKFYFHSAVVYFSRTDMQALTLAANYLRQVAAIRGDGAFLDAWDSTRINFDANALYACMGLLAAYEVLSDAGYLTTVKNFLTWFASMQQSAPGDTFTDGAWNIGYRVNPSGPPTYLPAIAPYDAQGISEIRWVDAVQCLGCFVLWWYWKLSGDTATRNALLPTFQKGIDGFIRNNYDGETGFFFSSWQNKTSPTMFLYNDAIRRCSPGGALLAQYNDADSFFVYTGAWRSYAPQGAVNSDEHFTLDAGDYFQFSLVLAAGDQVRWVTQTAFDTGIAAILISTDGVTFTALTSVDCYSADIEFQREFVLYTAGSSGTRWVRIQHSGTINPAGAAAPGWQRLLSRFSAGQSDVALGLMGLWLMTRSKKYSALAARIIRRFPGKFWSASDGRWFVSVDGASPGAGNNFWYPFTHGYTAFVQKQSRFFQPGSLCASGLAALEPYQDGEGGLLPPGYLEPEYIFSAFYVLGENQLAARTNPSAFDLAKNYVKSGQYFVMIGGVQVGGVVFSKRYQYLYTNISGFACMALAGVANPITEQLKLSISRMIMTQ